MKTVVASCCVLLVLGLGGGIALYAVTHRDQPGTVPLVKGLPNKDASARILAAGFRVRVDPGNSEAGAERLVSDQDPAGGTRMQRGSLVTVVLAPEKPVRKVVSICVDPGHSGRSGSETDPATGLNVGDNEGTTGERQTMWELAQVLRDKLQAAGFTVQLTKGSADEYVSLKQRADIGNTCDAVVRLHYDDTGFTGVMRAPVNAAKAPASDITRITVMNTAVANSSDGLAKAVATAIGLPVKDDTEGSSDNKTPPGHPPALVGSLLSRVPVICIENVVSQVRDNPQGREKVAAAIVRGLRAYFPPQ